VRLKRRFSDWVALACVPALVVLLEAFPGAGRNRLPWLNLAHTQLDYLWLYQFVEFTGDCGLSFWVAAAGSAAVRRLVRQPAGRSSGPLVVCL